MPVFRQLLAAFALLAGLGAVPAHAETFHTCGTIINTIPAVISTQGVYCLSHDLTTAISAGTAINIQTNNVTIDCNGYKLGGLAGGPSSMAVGIHADMTRLNLTVRNCGIRGFHTGIFFEGGAGHLIEDNRLDQNLGTAIAVHGENNRVQRNRIYDSGSSGGSTSNIVFALVAQADVIDNTVSGVVASGIDGYTTGIVMAGPGTEVRGNQVRGLAVHGAGTAQGISVEATGVTVRNNAVAAAAATPGVGIVGNGATDSICTGNTVFKFSTAIQTCQDAGGNASN